MKSCNGCEHAVFQEVGWSEWTIDGNDLMFCRAGVDLEIIDHEAHENKYFISWDQTSKDLVTIAEKCVLYLEGESDYYSYEYSGEYENPEH